MQQIYWRTPMPKCDFNKVAFAAYFQNSNGIRTENHLVRKGTLNHLANWRLDSLWIS